MNNTKLKSTKKEDSYSINNISNTLNTLPNTLKDLIYGSKNSNNNKITNKSSNKLKSQNIISQSLNNIPNLSSSLKESKLPIDTIISPNNLSKTKTNITLSIPNEELSKYTNELSKISPLNISTQNLNLTNTNNNLSNLTSKTKTKTYSNLSPMETLEQELIQTKETEKQPSSILGFILNISLSTWVIIILILAILGINIFSYLAQGTEFTTTFIYKTIMPILEYLGLSVKDTSQAIASTTENTLNKLNINKEIENKKSQTKQTEIQTETQPIQQTTTLINNSNYQEVNKVEELEKKEDEIEYLQRTALDNALNDAKLFYNENLQKQKQTQKADESTSEIQSKNKKGWCYIGTDNGIRSCSYIGVNDTCMSGNIYPNQEMCINPNLRM